MSALSTDGMSGTPATAAREEERRLWPSPADIRREHPVPAAAAAAIMARREEVRKVLDGTGDRLLAVIAPPPGARAGQVLQAAARLAAAGYGQDLLTVLHIPALPGTAGAGTEFTGAGIREARQLLGCAAGLLPVACGLGCPVIAWYYADLLSFGLVPARLAASAAYPQLVSGLPVPAGFTADGESGIAAAVAAVAAATGPQSYPGVTPAGRIGQVTSPGNPAARLILRAGPSAAAARRRTGRALDLLDRAGLPASLILDASAPGHAGGGYRPAAAKAAARQAAGPGSAITGIILGALPEDPDGRWGGVRAVLPALDFLAAAGQRREAARAAAHVPGPQPGQPP